MSLTRTLARAGIVVVVDEAYYPFGGATVIDRVTNHDNLVVVRSFSKALGLAGVRLGFVAGPEAVVNALFTVRASFDINALAIAAGEWVLDHPEIVATYVQEATRHSEVLRALAARHGTIDEAIPTRHLKASRVEYLIDPLDHVRALKRTRL